MKSKSLKSKRLKLAVMIALMLSIMLSLFAFLKQPAWAYETGDDYPWKGQSMDEYDDYLFYKRNCTSFVAWCLNSRNGVEFTNWYGGVRWGGAFNWGNAARQLGIAVDNNPAIGSVAWMSSGHVAWVKEVNGDNVTIDEYNWNGDGLYHSYTWPKSHYSGFIHIKDIGSMPIISYSNISIEKRAFQVGENVTFTMSSDAASYYWVGINDANGNRIDTHETGSGVSTYTRSFSTPGIYSCYASAVNSNGYLDSNVIYFTVYDKKPGTSKITTDHYSYQVGEEVTFTMSSDTAVSYWVGINDANGNRVDTHNTELNETTYQRSFTTPGRYCCYASAVNDCGYTDSEPVYFVVYDEKPKTSEISTDKKSYRVGEKVTFTMSSDTATCYWVGINDAESNRVDTYNTAIDETTYRRSFTTPGRYCCYASAVNNCGYTESELVYLNVLPDADAFTFLLPAALSAIEESAFEGSTAYVVYIPEGCTSIGSYAFKDCENLREIHIPTNCDISDTAFDGCGTIYVFGESGSSIENYCQSHNNCIFMEEE